MLATERELSRVLHRRRVHELAERGRHEHLREAVFTELARSRGQSALFARRGGDRELLLYNALALVPPLLAVAEHRRTAALNEGEAVADGLRVPRAIGDFLILRAVRESGGTAVAVSDAQMVDGMIEIGSCEGISAAPEGGAALAAIRALVEDGTIKASDSVVLFNTGGALKYLDALALTRHA